MYSLWSSCHLSCSQLQLRFFFVFILFATLAIVVATNEHSTAAAAVLQTRHGKIRGSVETTVGGRKYLAFRGMRYAVPPVKELRFKEPVPISQWEGVLDATTDAPVCPQLQIVTNQVIGQEDCLYLNVYTKSAKPEKKLPVLVFIHAGGFSSGTGSSELYGPDYLLGKFVVVSIQYRLSVLGFLSTGDSEATGNWGLLDQLEALKWVQSNIASFGGDAKKVTLLGEGAGAASATLLTLTQRAKGLFRNVIALGGSPLNSQYFQKTPLESARELGSRLDCSYENYNELLTCFRNAEVEKLVKETNAMFSFFSFPRWFAPSVDNILFDKFPEEILKSGSFLKVPVMLGLARDEGVFYYPLTLNSFNDGKSWDGNFIDQRLPRLFPVISEFESKLFPLTKAVKKRYFTNVEIDNEDECRPRYTEFLTDLLFTRFTSRYANELANQSVSVFYFVLDYVGTNSIMNIIGDSDIKSIAHGDVLQYIFTQVLGEDKVLPADDREFAKKIFLPLLTSFAKTGQPKSQALGDLTWPKFTRETQTVASIAKKIYLTPKFRTSILEFWNKTVPDIVASKSTTQKEEL